MIPQTYMLGDTSQFLLYPLRNKAIYTYCEYARCLLILYVLYQRDCFATHLLKFLMGPTEQGFY
jgi:hypothetical protein